jgi:glyoxylase-like metal-dependent hydrolase (beta-lactamase superfamily II)
MARMTPRRRRIFRNIVLGLLLLPLLLVLTVRLLRHQAGAPDPAGAGIVRVRNLFTDLYGVRVGDRIVVFDGGIDGEGKAVDALIGALGGGGRDAVTDVFLTHGHFDHVAEAPLCRRARIHLGRADVEMLAGRAPAVPPAARWLASIAPVPPIEASSPLDGPTTIPLGDGKEVFALPLPGHTPGSYVYYYEGVLIAGDSLQINGDRLELAIAFVSVDMDQNRRSVAGLRDALAGRAVHTVCTGHQGCTPPGRGAAMLDALITASASP